MNPMYVLRRAYERGGAMDLTTAEAAALEPHYDLLHDMHVLVPGPAAQLQLSALGADLMEKIAAIDNLDSAQDSAPGM